MATAPDDFDLQAAWQRTCESFAAVTGTNLVDRPVPTPEQIIISLKGEAKKEKKDNSKLEAAKDVLRKSITCIIRLGNVASQVASMFFGPSSICLNAVSIFVQAAVDYGNIFKGLDELFSRISDALERFQVYLDKQSIIDLSMKRIANDLLLRFVKICELSYKVLHRHRGLQFLKTIAFQDDAGVQAELDQLARLVERESQMRSTLNYVSTKTTEKNVETGFSQTLERLGENNSSIKRLEAVSELKRQQEEVYKVLGKPEDTLRAEIRECIGTAVPGTGNWLEEEVSFKQWADLGQNADSALFFSGDEGFGKTYLMSTAVQILEKQYPQGREDITRVSVASYFFKRPDKESKGDSKSSNRDSQSVDKALRALASQITQNDPMYRRDILNRYKDSPNSGDKIGELWDKLFASHYNSDATFFLVIDGIDHLEEKYEQVLLELLKDIQELPKGQLRLRLLLSGRVDMLEKIKSVPGIPLVTVDIALKNGDTVAKYIRKRVTNVKILKGSAAHVQSLREEVCIGLIESAKGDFINVDLLIEEISKKQRPDEIRAVLVQTKAGAARSDNLAREIERCNQSFTIDDIQDLSMLLTWVICAQSTLSLAQLEAVLAIRKHDPSLRPLYDRIRNEYSTFFQIRGPATNSDAEVTLKADTISEYFKDISSLADNGALSLSEEINEVEVRVVRRFLQSICDNELFEKFGFEDFFHNKLNKSNSVVNPDLETAHARILRDCLRVLLGEFEDYAYGLEEYAARSFADHLKQIDLSLTDPSLKAEIGRRLVTIFKDETALEKWCLEARYWLFDDTYVDTAMQWFRDSAAVKKITGDDKKWIDNLTSSGRSGGDLMECIARVQAKLWLTGPDSRLVGFQWIRCYINKLEHRKNPESTVLLTDDDYCTYSDWEDDEIYAAASEARKLLGLDDFEYDHICQLADTFVFAGKYDLAITEFQKAASLIQDHWKADSGQAIAYARLEHWELAIKTMEPVIKKLQDHNNSVENRETMLKENLGSIASWYRKLRKFDEARRIYDALLQESMADSSICLGVITLLDEQDKHVEAIEFLLQMKQQINESTLRDNLTQMFLDLADNDEYHTTIVKAARKSGSLNVIKENYQSALAAAKSGAKTKDEYYSPDFLEANLMYFLGIALYNHDTGDHEMLGAISLWEQVLAMKLRTGFGWWIKRRTVEKLATTYLIRARAAGYTSDTALSNLRKLECLFQPDGEDEEGVLDDTDRRFFLGHYYSLLNERDKAKDYLKPYIELAVALLSDDDPTNDWQGYRRLATGFMFAGDDTNALAAWSLIGPTKNLPPKQALEKSTDVQGLISETVPSLTSEDIASDRSGINGHKAISTDANETSAASNGAEGVPDPSALPSPPPPLKRSATSVLQRKPQGPLGNSCDGVCTTRWTYADDLHVCKYCLDVQFCSSCLDLLRTGELARQVCDTKHEFLYVPKWDFDRVEKIGKGNVCVGGKVMPVEEWIDAIRKHWGVCATLATTDG